ncbi:MAG TPA: diguanylate cyclase [Polyangiaceae bacterium]|jgi:diguanylate cyclase (GGDEF)-like protein/PAS domain S-box-containing protein|nr:diguanylate cyclase [Polyangiaceae bacterium]
MSALLRTKRIGWAFALLLSTLVLTFSYVSGRRYLSALRWVEHTHAVTRALEALLLDARELESEARGFVISGNPAFLAGGDAKRQSLATHLRAMSALVRDNPQQAARAQRLESALRKKLAFMAVTIDLRRRGEATEAERRTASLNGRALMDDVQALVAEMERDESRLLELRSRAADRTQRETVLAIGAGVFVLVVLLGLSFLGLQRDARELREAAVELAESEERYRVLADNVSDLVAVHTPSGELVYVSPSVESLLGHSPQQVHDLSPFTLLHPEDLASVRYSLEKLRAGEPPPGVLTCRLRRRDGEYRWFEFKVTRVVGAGGALRHFQSAARDVTHRRKLEQRLADQAEELRNLSLRDGLTGLYNRRGFLELSAQVVRVAERERHRLALLFVDLDGLKRINDELGHGHGDRAIAEAAELLRATCRATDLVARLGGDEFVVLAGNLDGDSVEILKARLDRALAHANERPGREYSVSFSLGVATFDPQAPVAIEALLAEADRRMYQAKAHRKRPASNSPGEVSSLA